MKSREPSPAEDDALVSRTVELFDGGFSFEQIAAELACDPDWARDVCMEVFLEERAVEPLH